MRIIAASIRNPIAIGVTVLLVCLFGALSLRQLPLQLFPDIERPTISIFTGWRGASPEEVEAELLEPQELRMALNQRLRAMVASTLTGALGALPMVLNPGPASTIYRGLAAVNVAGVIVSMVFSVLLLPSLMRLMYGRREPIAGAALAVGAWLLGSVVSGKSLDSPD